VRLSPAMSGAFAGGSAGIVPIGAALIMAATAMMLAIWAYGQATAVSELETFDLAELPPGVFRYHQGGDFSRDGIPVTAPTVTAVIARGLVMMRHQVTEAAYRRCVDAGACSEIHRGETAAADRPATGLSWRDASAYAAWLSEQSGMNFRLPSDAEWAYAAASRFRGDALPADSIAADPGRRALVRYEADSRRDQTADREPQPIGSFGINENGLADFAGNVWEWTDSCFTRNSVDQGGTVVVTGMNCGVRVVEGRHRAYVTDFIRDPRGGGCTVGIPPSNLGVRLVRDDSAGPGLRALLSLARRLVHSTSS
jgi:formylglycine-generating enzyme required for sulfatase activity